METPYWLTRGWERDHVDGGWLSEQRCAQSALWLNLMTQASAAGCRNTVWKYKKVLVTIYSISAEWVARFENAPPAKKKSRSRESPQRGAVGSLSKKTFAICWDSVGKSSSSSRLGPADPVTLMTGPAAGVFSCQHSIGSFSGIAGSEAQLLDDGGRACFQALWAVVYPCTYFCI